MAVRKELVEELLANRNPEEVFAQDGLLDELKKALAERILNAEMDQHLAAERADEVIGEPRNHRNGHSRKTVLTATGKLDLQVRQRSVPMLCMARPGAGGDKHL